MGAFNLLLILGIVTLCASISKWQQACREECKKLPSEDGERIWCNEFGQTSVFKGQMDECMAKCYTVAKQVHQGNCTSQEYQDGLNKLAEWKKLSDVMYKESSQKIKFCEQKSINPNAPCPEWLPAARWCEETFGNVEVNDCLLKCTGFKLLRNETCTIEEYLEIRRKFKESRKL